MMDIVQHTPDQLIFQARKPRSLVFSFGFGLILGLLCLQIGLGSLRHNQGYQVLCERVEAKATPWCRIVLPPRLRQGEAAHLIEQTHGYLTAVKVNNAEREQAQLQLQFTDQAPLLLNASSIAEAERYAAQIQSFLITPEQLRLELELIGYAQVLIRVLAGFPLLILGCLLLASFALALLKWRDEELLIFDRTANLYQVKYQHWWALRQGIKYQCPLHEIQQVIAKPLNVDDESTDPETATQLRLQLANTQKPLNPCSDLAAALKLWQPTATRINEFLQSTNKAIS